MQWLPRGVHAVQVKREDHVRPAGVFVHVRLGGAPKRLRFLHQLRNLPRVGHLHGLEPSHGGPAVGVVLDVVLGLGAHLLRDEQVLDVLVVNLNHRRGDGQARRFDTAVLLRRFQRGVARFENLLDRPRYQPARVVKVEVPVLVLGFTLRAARVAAEHGVRLTRTRLPCEQNTPSVKLPVQR